MDNNTKKKLRLIVVLILVSVLISILNELFKKDKINKYTSFTESAKSYYEIDFYKDNINIIKDYNNIGFKLNFKDVINEENRKLFKSCDTANAYAKIYPISPFGSTNYEINVVLDCE